MFYSRRNDTHPFDKIDDLEKYCKNTDSSLFVFGCNSKKRPNNIVIGRLYEHQLLDMVELGIEDISGIEDFDNLLKIPTHTRPAIIFQGDVWETDSSLSKVKNILHDFFVENIKLKEIEVNNALRLTITFSAYGNKIFMRTFEVILSGSNILEDEGKLSIEEVGPKVNFVLRRTRFADDELMKQATKELKVAPKKSVRHVSPSKRTSSGTTLVTREANCTWTGPTSTPWVSGNPRPCRRETSLRARSRRWPRSRITSPRSSRHDCVLVDLWHLWVDECHAFFCLARASSTIFCSSAMSLRYLLSFFIRTTPSVHFLDISAERFNSKLIFTSYSSYLIFSFMSFS